MTRISFTVVGNPAPQGSKTPWGTEANPRTRPWRDTIVHQAIEALAGAPPFLDAVNVDVTFRLQRPKSHYRTGIHADQLKPSAPVWCPKKPDVDKLCRAVLDALTTAQMWRDDSQVATLHARKVYARPGTPPGVDIVVQHLPEENA